MEWRQADVFKLIERYKERKLLWDPLMDDFKNRNKRHDAWTELDQLLSVETGENEKKIRKLVSQFNRECKKILKSGKGAEESGKWAYFKCPLFLKDKNKPRATLDGGFSEDETTVDAVGGAASQDTETHGSIDSEEITTLHSPESDNLLVPQIKPCSARARTVKRKSNAMAEEVYLVMKGLQNKKERDEFDAYGDTVAMTLRKLSTISATYAKFEINKILFSAEMGYYEPPAPPARPASTISYSSHDSNTSALVPTPMQSPLDYPSTQPFVGDDNTEIDTLLLLK